MCHPAVGIALAAISTAASIGGTVLSAQAQNAAAEEEMKNATASANAQQAQLQEQESQINDQAALEKLERQRQAMRERAAIRVNQGEAGVAGATANRELQDTYFQNTYDINIMEQNRKNAVSANRAQAKAVEIEGVGRWKNASARRTSSLATGLQIGSQIAGGIGQGAQYYKAFKKD